jgi:hypothetical protein
VTGKSKRFNLDDLLTGHWTQDEIVASNTGYGEEKALGSHIEIQIVSSLQKRPFMIYLKHHQSQIADYKDTSTSV